MGASKNRILWRAYLNAASTTSGECRLWTGTTRKGYGIVASDCTLATGQQYAHRLSFALYNGTLKDEHCIIHACSVPNCIEPRHLLQVPYVEASLIRDRKRRMARGETNANHKLTAADVATIRALKGTTTSRPLAMRYGVNRTQICRIWRGDSWC